MLPSRGLATRVDMASLYHALVAPFFTYAFMRRALVACAALSIGSGPIGVLLLLRRMSLIGDAMSHAVLPGAAAGFLVAGLSLWGMTAGGLVAGLVVAILAGVVSRRTALREDASFAGFYLTSLALGVMLVSLRGSNIDLLHILFGTILAVDDTALYLVGGIASISTVVLLAIYRPLILESFDPGFLRAVGGRGSLYHQVFMILVVLNLVAGFQALGTLMAVGLMMLPAAAARLWADEIWSMALIAMLIAFLSGIVGLLTSFQIGWPSGPAIILSASVFYVVSIVIGPCGGVLPARLRFTLSG
jgi:zinc/manganese transport system permease protein